MDELLARAKDAGPDGGAATADGGPSEAALRRIFLLLSQQASMRDPSPVSFS